MKSVFLKSVITVLVIGLALSVSVVGADDFPEVTEDGLRKVSDTKLAVVYAKDGVDLSVYNKVWLADATVAFKKNWQRDQNRSTRSLSNKVSAKDMDRIKTGLAELFREVFTETLTEAGHELVSESGDDVLIVRPAILNLDVNAPDTRSGGRSNTYVQSAGEMTLYIELYDSVTGDLLVKALDAQADRQSHHLRWHTEASNRAAAKKMLDSWADTLSANLSAAQSTATGSSEAE